MKHLILKISTLSLFLMSILSSCGDKEKITLAYNLKQGEILKQNVVMTMDLVQKLGNQEMKLSLTMDMKMTFDIKESQNDDYTIELKFKELKTDVVMPAGMGNITIDSKTSANAVTHEDMGPIFKAVVDKPVEVVMTKTGKIKSVAGMETLIEAMANSFSDSQFDSVHRQQIIEQFGSQFSEKAFISQFEQYTGYFPDKPVRKGDSWKVKMTTTASNFSVNIETKSTLKDIDNNVVSLGIDGTVATPEGYEQDVNGVNTKLSFKGSQKGTLKINKDTGWVISADIAMNFNGEVDAAGMKVPVYIASKITVTGE
jgi:hypothetical protein